MSSTVSMYVSVIVGNNLDEENDRQVETFDALNWACSENLGGCFVETSAKNNLGVKDAFPFHCFSCYIYPHKTVRSMFRLAFLFPTTLICDLSLCALILCI
jgi:hypothetical protein